MLSACWYASSLVAPEPARARGSRPRAVARRRVGGDRGPAGAPLGEVARADDARLGAAHHRAASVVGEALVVVGRLAAIAAPGLRYAA